MKTWTNPIALAALAATLTLAACTEDGPANMTEAEPEAPEAFDPETVYQIVPIGVTKPSLPGGHPAIFVQYVSEEAKRRNADLLAEDAVFHLVPLSAERAALVWDNKRVVYVMGVPGEGPWVVHAHNYTLPNRYGPDRERRREVRR